MSETTATIASLAIRGRTTIEAMLLPFTAEGSTRILGGRSNSIVKDASKRARSTLKSTLDGQIIRQIAAVRIVDGGIPTDSAARGRHQTRDAVNGRMSSRKGGKGAAVPAVDTRALRRSNQRATTATMNTEAALVVRRVPPPGAGPAEWPRLAAGAVRGLYLFPPRRYSRAGAATIVCSSINPPLFAAAAPS